MHHRVRNTRAIAWPIERRLCMERRATANQCTFTQNRVGREAVGLSACSPSKCSPAARYAYTDTSPRVRSKDRRRASLSR
eukprot:3093026-Pleurochrysis_carterae.AAC.2